MLLASLLLKLGGYGLIVFSPLIFMQESFFTSAYSRVSVISLVLIRGLCLAQSDIKKIIAYSSVAHMALVIFNCSHGRNLGLTASILIILCHGLSSSLLFLVAHLLYARAHTRRIFLANGLAVKLPAVSFFLFLGAIFNMAAPPSFCFAGEVTAMVSIFSSSHLNLPPLIFATIMAAAYNLLLYNCLSHGKPTIHTEISALTLREYSML